MSDYHWCCLVVWQEPNCFVALNKLMYDERGECVPMRVMLVFVVVVVVVYSLVSGPVLLLVEIRYLYNAASQLDVGF